MSDELRRAAEALVERLRDHSLCPVCDADLGEGVPHEDGCELRALEEEVTR